MAASSASVAPEVKTISSGRRAPRARAARRRALSRRSKAARPTPYRALALAFTARLAGPGTWKGAMALAASAHKGAVAA